MELSQWLQFAANVGGMGVLAILIVKLPQIFTGAREAFSSFAELIEKIHAAHAAERAADRAMILQIIEKKYHGKENGNSKDSSG